MTAHTNVCVIGLGSMGMGAARACLQAGLNTWGGHQPRQLPRAAGGGRQRRRLQRGAFRR